MTTAIGNLTIKEARPNDLSIIKNILKKESLPSTDIVLDVMRIFLFYEKQRNGWYEWSRGIPRGSPFTISRGAGQV